MIKKIKNKFKQRKIRKAQRKEYLKNLPSAYDHTVISWIAPEHTKHERGRLWKVLIPAMLLAAIILGVLHNAWTFSLAIVVFATVYYALHREHPKDVDIIVSDIGIKVGERRYPYSRIKAFWIIYDPPYIKTLNLHVNGEFAVHIPVQLGDQNPAEIREFLLEKIPEREGETESLSDIFLRLFKI